jgi:hypothetical protein
LLAFTAETLPAVLNSLLQVAVRLVFGLAVLILLLGLMALGLVLAVVVFLVALVTRRKPQWGTRAQHWGQQTWRRYGAPHRPGASKSQGEVIEADVREIP